MMLICHCDQGWCWKGLLGGGALYGPADWNGALSGQEVRLSEDLEGWFYLKICEDNFSLNLIIIWPGGEIIIRFVRIIFCADNSSLNLIIIWPRGEIIIRFVRMICESYHNFSKRTGQEKQSIVMISCTQVVFLYPCFTIGIKGCFNSKEKLICGHRCFQKFQYSIIPISALCLKCLHTRRFAQKCTLNGSFPQKKLIAEISYFSMFLDPWDQN